MSALQAMIDTANARKKMDNKRVFAKKANDQQHHLNLFKHTQVALDAFHKDQMAGVVVSNNLRAAMREMETAMKLSEKRLA